MPHKPWSLKNIFVGIGIVVLLLVGGVYFFGGLQQSAFELNTVAIPMSSTDLYQHTGVQGTFKEKITSGQSCVVPAMIGLGGYVFSDDSYIQTANHAYKITITNTRQATNNDGDACGAPAYDVTVYDNGIGIDSFSAGVGATCSETVTSRNLKKEYPELTAVFGAGYDYSGDTMYCSTRTAAVAHEYQLNYPTDTVTQGFTLKGISNGIATMEMTINLKYHDMISSVAVYLDPPIGGRTLITSKEMPLRVGANTVTFEVPIKDDTATIELVPVITLYGDKSRLGNINAMSGWKDGPHVRTNDKYKSFSGTAYSVNAIDYTHYLIGEFEGSTSKVVIKEGKVESQEVIAGPTQTEIPTDTPAGSPNQTNSGGAPATTTTGTSGTTTPKTNATATTTKKVTSDGIPLKTYLIIGGAVIVLALPFILLMWNRRKKR